MRVYHIREKSQQPEVCEDTPQAELKKSLGYNQCMCYAAQARAVIIEIRFGKQNQNVGNKIDMLHLRSVIEILGNIMLHTWTLESAYNIIMIYNIYIISL